MQTIYKSDYCEYIFHSEIGLLIGRWFNTDHMTQDMFKNELVNGELFSIKEHKPKVYLVDTSSFQLPITPDTQQWMAENITINYAKYGVKRIAFLSSESFVVQLSIQQSNGESVDREVEKKHFNSEEEALNWLKS